MSKKRTPTHIKHLVPDPQNRRKHNPRNIGMLTDALHKVGAARSIVIDEENEILAGNGVIEAAADAGITKVQVVDVDGSTIVAVRRKGLTVEQKRQLAIYDNRTAELAGWDLEQLRADVAGGEDLSAFFYEDELAALLASEAVEPVAGLTDPDAVPAQRATDIKLGDLFELGRHRLLCGDCTDPTLIERLMDGARAGLMNTDPPYGVTYANDDRPNPGVAKPRVANDTLSEDALQRFLESAFGVAKLIALGEKAAWYMWHAHLTQGYFAAAAAAANVVLHRQIIWVKPVLLLGRGHYHWKHEPCFMGWVEGQQPPDYGLGNGERTQTTVWEVAHVTQAERKEFNHSTPKPVGLFTIPIVKHLRAGEACYEPFAGSGPQFIAAEQHGVRCFGAELAPVFCQVIIDRWEAFTGQKAQKVGEAVGAS
jgi:DNA modification methylase